MGAKRGRFSFALCHLCKCFISRNAALECAGTCGNPGTRKSETGRSSMFETSLHSKLKANLSNTVRRSQIKQKSHQVSQHHY